jgi:serine/threonine-protein kinase PknG
MTTATVRCTQPGCDGTIQDGYCDTCGLAAPTSSSGASGPSGSAGSALSASSSGSSRSTRSRARGRGTSRSARGRLGRGRDGHPGLAEGFCRNCGTRFSFSPELAPGELVPGQYEVLGCLAHGGLGWIYLLIDLGGVCRIDSDEAIYGTVGYQAPEIEVDGPSPSSDLYTVGRALAVLAFEFRGFQSTYKHSLPDGVPLLGEQESLARLLRRATHHDPDRRFGSAGEMAEQLTGVLREVLAVTDTAPRPAFSTVFSPEVQAIGTHADPLPSAPAAPVAATPPAAPPPFAASVPAVRLVPPPPTEIVAGVTLAVSGDATIPREVTESAETRLALARARIDVGDYDAAAVVLADLADGAQIAQGAFSSVYDELPGELAPKLALAFAAVPPASSHHAAAQIAAVRILVSGVRRQQLTVEILRAALNWCTSGQPAGGSPILGCEPNARALRFGLERSYRALAGLTPETARRVELVDLANAIRPRTLT